MGQAVVIVLLGDAKISPSKKLDTLLQFHTGKRRAANHPCPVCGKSYVNEGSLRKHIAGHPETTSVTSPLRMWPCSVCQSVFTQESGLLSHMEHMRMDPKHQFAAQYVLSRAAAERRERESGLMGPGNPASLGQPMTPHGNPLHAHGPPNGNANNGRSSNPHPAMGLMVTPSGGGGGHPRNNP
ncbi:hypothetical protein CHUAL_007127 [Chamberlinius hualienensis]